MSNVRCVPNTSPPPSRPLTPPLSSSPSLDISYPTEVKNTRYSKNDFEPMDGYTNGRTYVQTDERMGGWTDGRMDTIVC